MFKNKFMYYYLVVTRSSLVITTKDLEIMIKDLINTRKDLVIMRKLSHNNKKIKSLLRENYVA